jgi:heme-degrading monooxygenase HmoA
MSVFMMLRIDVDPKTFEEYAAANPDQLKAISDQAVGHGLIAHRFLGNDDSGQTMVVDEWEKPEDFQAFFEKVGPDVQALMGDMGVTSPPVGPEFWRILESHDKQGWEDRAA